MSKKTADGKAEKLQVPTARQLPRWAELPDLDLYMDQVISLMERYLGEGARALTPSMVNNYVKTGLVPSPVKKRYGQIHLACLLVVCALKPVLPLSAIRELLSPLLDEGEGASAFYDLFCELFEEAERAACDALGGSLPPDIREASLRAALNAQAQQAVALALSASEAE